MSYNFKCPECDIEVVCERKVVKAAVRLHYKTEHPEIPISEGFAHRIASFHGKKSAKYRKDVGPPKATSVKSVSGGAYRAGQSK